MSTLILTEKRDQAEKIAKVFGFRQGRGCFEGTFEGQPAKICFARGHLVELQNPDEVIPGLPWDNLAALVPIPHEFPMRVTKDSPNAPPVAQPRRYVDNIKHHLKGCTRFIISTDSDREGEAIGWNLLEHLGYHGKVERAWLAAGLDEKSIREAFSSLRPPHVTKSWFRASQARARSDWAFMFLVRAYTHLARHNAFGRLLGEGRGREGVMSVGRVQSPALGMIVRREREIRNFVPVDHFKVSGAFALTGGNLLASYRPQVTAEIIESQPPGVTWDPQPPKQDGTPVLDKPLFTDRKAIEAFQARLMAAKDRGIVRGYQTRTRNEQPPKTFSLTDAQAAIGRALKLDAGLVQTILEDLYEQGWISYARTSKSELPRNLYEPGERNAYLNSIKGLSELAEAANTVQDIHNGKHPTIKPFMPKVFVDKDMQHYGMVPTHAVMTPKAFAGLTPRKAERGAPKHTTAHMQQAYLLVAKQFIQALYPPAQWAVQEMDLEMPVADLFGAPTSQFSAKGERLIEPGWRAAFGVGAEKDTSLPVAKKADQASLMEVVIASAKTTPPARYNEVTLPKAMETIAREVRDPELRKLLKDSEGLGTPASRKDVINTIQARAYVESKRGAYYATPKGEAVYDSIEDWLRIPETTALWEDKLVALCGETDDRKAIAMRDEFVTAQVERVESLIRDLTNRFRGKLADKPIAAAPNKVTPNMKNAMKSVADRKGITLPKGILSDPVKAKAFLDEHIGDRPKGAPSPAALDFARKLIPYLPEGVEPPADLETNQQACSKFIDEAKQYQPPSPKSRALAESLLDKMPENERPDPAFLNSADKVSKFIDEQFKKSRKSTGGKTGGAKRSMKGGQGSTGAKSSRGSRPPF